jgi:microcystin-dependent protein
MPGNFTKLVTVTTGQLITAAERNNEFDNVIANCTPTGIDDESSNVTAMQATEDPYPASVESLATSLKGELKRLRYLVAQLTGKTYWYQDPETSLNGVIGALSDSATPASTAASLKERLDHIVTQIKTGFGLANWYATVAAPTIVPPGSIFPYGGATAPSGWLLCNGAAISRTTYATLFAIVGTAFGSGDGSTTFNIPDFRGRFLRGWDNSAGRDPDAAGRTAMSSGGDTGDKIGSVQDHAFDEHTHTQDAHGHGVTDGGHNHDKTASSPGISVDSTGSTRICLWNNGGGTTTGSSTTGLTVNNATATNQNSGGNETRPVNANVNYIIKS